MSGQVYILSRATNDLRIGNTTIKGRAERADPAVTAVTMAQLATLEQALSFTRLVDNGHLTVSHTDPTQRAAPAVVPEPAPVEQIRPQGKGKRD